MSSFSARRLLCCLLLLCLMLSLAGCGKTPVEAKDPPDTETSDPALPTPDLPGGEPTSEMPDPVAEGTTPSESGVNPLTGLSDGISDEALNRRPVAIMVSNIITSLPQWGVSDADILVEMLAEGRITRLMAIYQDYTKIDHIASIRSARPYFIDMAQSFGAVYIHFGGSVPAYNAIAARKDLIDLDGIKGSWEGTVFFRDPGRKAELGSEHSVYTTGELLGKAFTKMDADLSQTEHPSAFAFSGTSDAASGESGTKVQIVFSENHKPYFEYDPGIGKYLRYEYGAKQMDGWTNEQISVKNVLILRMDVTDVPNNALHLIEVQTTGSGEGYYFCEGRYIPIVWSKGAYNGELKICGADGQEIRFVPGQTFISCCARTGKVNIW